MHVEHPQKTLRFWDGVNIFLNSHCSKTMRFFSINPDGNEVPKDITMI